MRNPGAVARKTLTPTLSHREREQARFVPQAREKMTTRFVERDAIKMTHYERIEFLVERSPSSHPVTQAALRARPFP